MREQGTVFDDTEDSLDLSDKRLQKVENVYDAKKVIAYKYGALRIVEKVVKSQIRLPSWRDFVNSSLCGFYTAFFSLDSIF